MSTVSQSGQYSHRPLLDAATVTNSERADMLSEYLDLIPPDLDEIRLMTITSGTKSPAICDEGVGLDSDAADKMLVSGKEAVRSIRYDGTWGFASYAGREKFGTENLVWIDHDDMNAFPAPTADRTLTVRSGSGRGVHETYRNAGNVKNARVGDGEGEVRAKNWYVVTPGSLHPSGGVYHVEKNRECQTLSATDLPEKALPAKVTNSQTMQSESYANTSTVADGVLVYDADAASVVRQSLREFAHAADTTERAVRNVKELIDGKYSEWGHDGDHSAAEVDLASSLYGILRFTNADENPRQRLYSFMVEVSEEQKWADDGDRRKWYRRGDAYRASVLSHATDRFVEEIWDRWRFMSDGSNRYSGEPSSIVYDVTLRALRDLNNTGEYPTRSQVVDACQEKHGDRSGENYRKALRFLKDRYDQVKMADCGGNKYVYYPPRKSNPPGAHKVNIGGEDYEPGEAPK